MSTSTIPSPAAIAHAFPCGTPGQGSGRRSRHSPASTRSPRPFSLSRARIPIVGTIEVGAVRAPPRKLARAVDATPAEIALAYFPDIALTIKDLRLAHVSDPVCTLDTVYTLDPVTGDVAAQLRAAADGSLP